MVEEEREQRGFRVTGRVQGVFFRVWTQRVAQDLGLAGTVQNLRDGSVEAHVRGSVSAVRAFEKRLWTGPPAAVVDEVSVLESSVQLPGDGFQILPTA